MAARDPRIWQVLGGKYRIEELLARGGMGLVYGARHLVTDRQVAIKLLRLELLNQPELVWRVSVEGRLAAVAAHPNVVEVLDAGTDDGVPYVVQERLRGEPLESLLGEPLSLRVTVQALMPVINAVAHLHRSGLIHRDIKPTNIFLAHDADRRLTPKLLDFGIAKALQGGERTGSGIALGTPAYMAPEQAMGSRALGTASDVWSMAVVFVRCLTGQLPFSASAAPRPNTLRLRAADMACVPEPVARVLSDALELEPSERLRDMSLFRANLSAALRVVDPNYPWPDETSVGYFGDDCELKEAFRRGARADTEPEPTESATSASVRARPGDVRTRTLLGPGRFRLRIRPRSTLVLLAAVLLWLGLAALRDSPEETRAHHATDVQQERSLERAWPNEPWSGPEPTATHDQPPNVRQSEPSTNPSRRQPAPARRPHGRNEPPPSPETSPAAQARHALGANRSPIIE